MREQFQMINIRCNRHVVVLYEDKKKRICNEINTNNKNGNRSLSLTVNV